jgi:hypothetical protein
MKFFWALFIWKIYNSFYVKIIHIPEHTQNSKNITFT